MVSGLNFSNDNRTVSADGWEHCVALGSVGFSRGVHYWEFTIDRYTADTDPAFGIARIDVARDKMLGKWLFYFIFCSLVKRLVMSAGCIGRHKSPIRDCSHERASHSPSLRAL